MSICSLRTAAVRTRSDGLNSQEYLCPRALCTFPAIASPVLGRSAVEDGYFVADPFGDAVTAEIIRRISGTKKAPDVQLRLFVNVLKARSLLRGSLLRPRREASALRKNSPSFSSYDRLPLPSVCPDAARRPARNGSPRATRPPYRWGLPCS